MNSFLLEGREVLPSQIEDFGSEVSETMFKNGEFKGFVSKVFIKLRGQSERIFLDKVKLSDVRAFVKNAKLISRRPLQKVNKRGTLKKKTAYFYKVVVKGAKVLRQNQCDTLHACVKKKRIFKLSDRIHFYYIYEKFFKEARSDIFFYFDEHKKLLVNTGFVSGFGEVSKKGLDTWRKEYHENQ